MRSEAALPSVPGVLTAGEVAATAQSIVAQQEESGAIPWFSPPAGCPATWTPGTTSRPRWR